jgi:hypothetical protein
MARNPKGSTEVARYFKRAEQHYESLFAKNLIQERANANFIVDFLKCRSGMKNSWYVVGIRPIYYVILDLLDENGKLRQALRLLREGRKICEKQLDEMLK